MDQRMSFCRVGASKPSTTYAIFLGAILLASTQANFVANAANAAAAADTVLKIAVAPGTRVQNADGACLEFAGLRDAIIEDVVIGPCAGNGIDLSDSHNVVIRNVTIAETGGSAIYAYSSTGIHVEESSITGGVSGVYVVSSSQVQVTCNTFLNPRGPVPRGQFVQFDKVTGEGNEISCNVGRNEPGKGEPEDTINLYQSRGSAQSPIIVRNNLIIGGGPSVSGGGIMLGDSGGEHQVAEGNDLIDPGQYGIGVASGSHMRIRDNRIFARQQPFTNVGIYVWNQYPHVCSDVSVESNAVRWASKTGQPNPFWNGANCGAVTGIMSNDFRAKLTADTVAREPGACTCAAAGRH